MDILKKVLSNSSYSFPLLALVSVAALSFPILSATKQDEEQRRIYNHLSAKTTKVADKNLDGRLDISESRTILSKISPNSYSADARLLEYGFHLSIKDMQNYLKTEGKFGERTDDSTTLDPRRKNFSLPFNLSL